MADDAPHDGDSPRMKDEPDVIPLPPRIQPFDPERYHLVARVLPPNLLLREPESHLSYDTPEVHTVVFCFTHGYGSTITREWYMDLLVGVQQIIDEAGFGLFCMGLSRLMASRSLLGALVERWWDTTNSLHFSATGDMTMTPYDFAMLTGLEMGGRPIPYDPDMELWVYTYFPVLAPKLEVMIPFEVPYSHRYDSRCQLRARETLSYLHLVAALGVDARQCQIRVCRSLGRFPVPDLTYMMSPLTGVRAPVRRTADVASSNRTWGADTPLTTARGRARGMPPTRQSVGWPDPLIELTSWRYGGVPYQIPLNPPLLDHRYVRTPDSPPICITPSIDYVKGLLEVMAFFEGMILRREMMLTSQGIQTNEDEEAASPQSESSEGGGDGTGSGSKGSGDVKEGSKDWSGDSSGSSSSSDSDSGADRDSATESTPPRKRTKRASQS
ncbi:hypothetical protein CsSME_00001719 [Camellia sinensis var. sinensis]